MPKVFERYDRPKGRKLVRPQGLMEEYEAYKEPRAIHNLKDFPVEHQWRLDEVKESLYYHFGRIWQYHLVSSWVDGSYFTEQCPKEWADLKRRKNSWDGLMPDTRLKYSDFDINVSTWDGQWMGFKAFIYTKSGIKVDLYPHKGERGLILNEPENARLIQGIYSKGLNKI